MSCTGCTEIQMVEGCLKTAAGLSRTIKIYTEFGVNAAGAKIVVATRYANADDTLITLAAGDTVTVGACTNTCPPATAQGLVTTWG